MASQLLWLLRVLFLLLLSVVLSVQEPAPGLRLHLGRPLSCRCRRQTRSICIYAPSSFYCCCYGLWRWWWWLQVCGV
jgi:hypothetical protein